MTPIEKLRRIAASTALDGVADAIREVADELGRMVSEAPWYSVDSTGAATLCVDEGDAIDEARDNNIAYPRLGPHRPRKLIQWPAPAAKEGVE